MGGNNTNNIMRSPKTKFLSSFSSSMSDGVALHNNKSDLFQAAVYRDELLSEANRIESQQQQQKSYNHSVDVVSNSDKLVLLETGIMRKNNA